jgi:hypothetical protein
MKVLGPIWNTKPDTASRVRGRIEVILDWAKVSEYRSGETRRAGADISITCSRQSLRSARSSTIPHCRTRKSARS